MDDVERRARVTVEGTKERRAQGEERRTANGERERKREIQRRRCGRQPTE